MGNKPSSLVATPRSRARPSRIPPPPIASQGLASALFTQTQQRVLGLLFGQPDRSFFASELIHLAGAGSGAVQRELARLEQSGLVTVTRIGNQKHFQASRESPIYSELVGIITKTVGLADPLRTALEPFRGQIHLAFVYGSIAKGGDTASSDIDLMIVSDKVRYTVLYAALEAAEAQLARKINPTLYTSAEWRKRRATEGFLNRVLAQRRLMLVGDEAAIG